MTTETTTQPDFNQLKQQVQRYQQQMGIKELRTALLSYQYWQLNQSLQQMVQQLQVSTTHTQYLEQIKSELLRIEVVMEGYTGISTGD